jgi:hypothetical protein
VSQGFRFNVNLGRLFPIPSGQRTGNTLGSSREICEITNTTRGITKCIIACKVGMGKCNFTQGFNHLGSSTPETGSSEQKLGV